MSWRDFSVQDEAGWCSAACLLRNTCSPLSICRALQQTQQRQGPWQLLLNMTSNVREFFGSFGTIFLPRPVQLLSICFGQKMWLISCRSFWSPRKFPSFPEPIKNNLQKHIAAFTDLIHHCKWDNCGALTRPRRASITPTLIILPLSAIVEYLQPHLVTKKGQKRKVLCEITRYLSSRTEREGLD